MGVVFLVYIVRGLKQSSMELGLQQNQSIAASDFFLLLYVKCSFVWLLRDKYHKCRMCLHCLRQNMIIIIANDNIVDYQHILPLPLAFLYIVAGVSRIWI